MRVCEVLRQWRWAVKADQRAVAKEIGLGASTLSRVENGEIPNGLTLGKILCWLLSDSSEMRSEITMPNGEPADIPGKQ